MMAVAGGPHSVTNEPSARVNSGTPAFPSHRNSGYAPEDEQEAGICLHL